MIRTGIIVRLIAKTALWSFAVLLSILVVWFAVNRVLDERPDPGRDAFLVSSQDQISDDQNIAVGILGLTAPAGANFLENGSNIKRLYASNAPWPEIRQMIRGPKTLRPTVESEQVTCWIDPYDPIFKEFKQCIPFDQASEVLQQNQELLDRFRALSGLGHYASLGTFYNEAYLILVKMSLADMHLDLRRRDHESAYRKWRDQMVLTRAAMRGPDTWVGKAVGLVAFGMTLPFLENLLLADRNIARRHASELRGLLQSPGIDAINPEGLIRAEYAMLQTALDLPPRENPEWPPSGLDRLTFHLGQRNRVLNRYHAFAGDYLATLRLPWDRYDKETDRLREAHVFSSGWDFAIDPFGTVLLARYIGGELKALEMLREVHRADGRLRLATLLVRVVKESVGDSEIPRFLASADLELYDPFSGNPMQWDQKERKIFFPDPRDRCSHYAYVRVPKLARTRDASVPNVQEMKC